MAVNKITNQYQESAIFTSTPEELTLMLYNGAVKFIKLSQIGIEEKNYERVNTNIIKAQNIFDELTASLDMQYDISKNLQSLYEYFNRRLVEANIKKDNEILNEVLKFTEDLRDTWSQAMKIARMQRVK